MSQIGTLVTGAGIVTTLPLQFVPEFILVGTLDTDLPLTAISWNVAGDEKVNITGAAALVAYSKLKLAGLLGADVKLSQVLRVADGYIGNQQFQVRLTNAGVTTPAIYGYSTQKSGGRILKATQNVILDGANQSYEEFLALQFLPTNVARAEVVFYDSERNMEFSESMTMCELASLFAQENTTDADGLTGTYLTIDNAMILQEGLSIKRVTLYVTGANVTVTIIGLDTI